MCDARPGSADSPEGTCSHPTIICCAQNRSGAGPAEAPGSPARVLRVCRAHTLDDGFGGQGPPPVSRLVGCA
jgi:hypothetical protein